MLEIMNDHPAYFINSIKAIILLYRCNITIWSILEALKKLGVITKKGGIYLILSKAVQLWSIIEHPLAVISGVCSKGYEDEIIWNSLSKRVGKQNYTENTIYDN